MYSPCWSNYPLAAEAELRERNAAQTTELLATGEELTLAQQRLEGQETRLKDANAEIDKMWNEAHAATATEVSIGFLLLCPSTALICCIISCMFLCRMSSAPPLALYLLIATSSRRLLKHSKRAAAHPWSSITSLSRYCLSSHLYIYL